MDMLSCFIAGHTPQRFKFKFNEEAPLCCSIKESITMQIRKLYSKGVRRFYVGCAIGVDMWAAEIVIALKTQAVYADIELFCAIPFPDHTDKFTAGQKKRYDEILNKCTHKEIISRHYSPVAYKRLNYYMVEKSRYLIAVFDQDKSARSTLTQMINYAIKNNLSIIYVHPDTAVVSEHIE